MNRWRRLGAMGTTAAAVVVLVAACQSTSQTSTESSESASATAAATSGAATPTPGSGGEAALDAPSEVGAGEKFDVSWTGPNGQGDYITIVAASATKWTDEPYFYTTGSSPGSLVASTQDGAYELWYVSAAGDTDTILARRAITVTPFEGALDGPAEVEAGTTFEVAWNGPNGPGDFVTIVAAGSTKWTNESYFYTASANPGKLVSPIEPGAYELWYVTGADDVTQDTQPITVTPSAITLDAPDTVNHGANFQVTWTGPNGPGDYITIVPAGSPEGTYRSYAYTANGSPVTLTAPDGTGNYEIWYASDRVDGTFASINIVVN